MNEQQFLATTLQRQPGMKHDAQAVGRERNWSAHVEKTLGAMSQPIFAIKTLQTAISPQRLNIVKVSWVSGMEMKTVSSTNSPQLASSEIVVAYIIADLRRPSHCRSFLQVFRWCHSAALNGRSSTSSQVKQSKRHKVGHHNIFPSSVYASSLLQCRYPHNGFPLLGESSRRVRARLSLVLIFRHQIALHPAICPTLCLWLVDTHPRGILHGIEHS